MPHPVTYWEIVSADKDKGLQRFYSAGPEDPAGIVTGLLKAVARDV